MAIELLPGARGRSLLLDGLAQSDVDMNNFRLLNLDDSNLEFGASPPTIGPVAHQWLRSWNSTTRVWGISQPAFTDISGNLTLGVNGQQQAITQLGTIAVGTWHGSVIAGTYLARLNEIRFPTGPTNIGFQRLINLADPVEPFDAVTKRFMDFLLQGLNVHEAVRVATTTRISANGLPIIDGVQTHVGDRVLIKNVNPGEEQYQGIWIAASGTWTLAPDYDTVADMTRTYVAVREGAVNAGTSWVQVNPVTVITDPKNFVYFTLAGGEQGPPGVNGQGVPTGGAEGYVLAKNSTADYDTEWVPPGFAGVPNYAIVQTGVASPVGTTNATGRMMGLAGYITPQTSGKAVATIAGYIYNTSAAGAAATRLCVGTGTAPVNGVAQPAGSFLVGAQAAVSSIGASKVVPFSVSVVLSSLTVGSPVWFDLLLQSITTGTATVGGVSVTVFEIP